MRWIKGKEEEEEEEKAEEEAEEKEEEQEEKEEAAAAPLTFHDDFVFAEVDLDLGQIRGNRPNVSTFLADDESDQVGNRWGMKTMEMNWQK